MYMLFGIFKLNSIKFFSCLYLVMVNIIGCQRNRIKERFLWRVRLFNQYHTELIIMPVTLFYYYEIIYGGVNYKL
ncbi:hypothetical protein C5470_12760 [Photorhabdus stackebrandtii]|uniref:Uncharacterized protein n=1 Tax=Photorhabdus stackebrandtii TaxID=1123042 RepID=A0A7X5QMQ3_9GAMM|nr:hypothetical protein [Photorhabdus stackebrandtii]